VNDTPEGANPASTLGKLGGSKGGRARAERLTPAERSAAARDAAEARWGNVVAHATHEGVLIIGDHRLECAVLEDAEKTRVINQSTMLTALGRAPTMGRRELTEGRPPFLSAANLRPYISRELMELYEPVNYRHVTTSGRSLGYRAVILPMVCEVYLDARNEGALLKNQDATAKAAEILIRGLARVGIIALIDEATGYQEVRARRELEKILEAYVQAQFRPWVSTFPDDFFREIYRLHGWEFRPGQTQRNPGVGKMIKHYVYGQLPPGVLAELERVNPKNQKGQRPRKHHQHLTQTTGNEHLDKQITSVITLMKISRNRQEFEDFFERAFPPPEEKLPLVIDIYEATKDRSARKQ
jgi:P63C domain